MSDRQIVELNAGQIFTKLIGDYSIQSILTMNDENFDKVIALSVKIADKIHEINKNYGGKSE